MASTERLEKQKDAAGFGYGFATMQNPAWSVTQVLEATKGRLLSGESGTIFRSISTDTRTIEAGDLFLALPGEKFDGLTFVGEAVRKGAAGVVLSGDPVAKIPVVVVQVEDCLRALGDLAHYRRHQMKNLTVLAITGSSGKTSVKEMTAAILAETHNLLKTKGNFNNLIGMPLSLLPVDSRHRLAVLEMGMNQPGEIARLTEIADPDLACIVNIQGAHLAGFGDIEGVARAKGELFAGCRSDSRLVVNIDDPRILELARQYKQEKITFGLGAQAMVRATHIRNLGENGMAFTLRIGAEKSRVTLRGLGLHNVTNSLAAAAMAHGVGVPVEKISSGLGRFMPFEKRLQIQRLVNGLKVVNDSYNANPSSVLAALETVQDLNGGSRKVAVLGDMMELGQQSRASHQFIGESVARLGFDYLLTAGAFGTSVVEAARKAGMAAEQAKRFEHKEEIAPHIEELVALGNLRPGDWVLVKGSRSMRMETIIADLLERSGGELK